VKAIRIAPPWSRPWSRCLWILRHRRWSRRTVAVDGTWHGSALTFHVPVTLAPGESISVPAPGVEVPT